MEKVERILSSFVYIPRASSPEGAEVSKNTLTNTQPPATAARIAKGGPCRKNDEIPPESAPRVTRARNREPRGPPKGHGQPVATPRHQDGCLFPFPPPPIGHRILPEGDPQRGPAPAHRSGPFLRW